MEFGEVKLSQLAHGEPDDSALLMHRAAYDPRKAHEYYLRTRHLRGRKAAGQYDESKGETYYRQAGQALGNQANDGMRPSRRKELLAQREALQKRLAALEHALQVLVEESKKRSGVKTKPDSTKKGTVDTKTKQDKKAGKTDDKPLTEKQKADKREASREQYQKEQQMGLTGQVESLQLKIKDIRAKLDKALKDAREQQAKSKPQTASNGR